jgi:hypothetical protein
MRNFLVLLSLTTFAHAYDCKVSTDAKKVVLFVDTNGSLQEIETAQKAACKRGETFVLIPKPSMLVKEVIAEQASYITRKKKYDKACSAASEYCTGELKELDRLFKDLATHFKQLPKADDKTLDNEIASLSKNNTAISSVIFSGHNGGGSIAGITGRINKSDFFSSMNKHYGKMPHLKDSLHSVLLWGCYSATPEEIMEWKAAYPTLKIIAGFNGVAPSNTQLAGTNIMKDLLINEAKLTSQVSPQKVKKAIQDLQSIQTTYSGIYVNSCGEEYYYNKDFNGTHFKTFNDMKSCAPPNLPDELAKFQQFFSGALPHNEAEMRRIYDYARQFDHCFPTTHPLEGDHVALLLFFKAVKYNFANVYADTLKSAEEEFQNLEKTLNEFEKKKNKGIFNFGSGVSVEDMLKLRLAIKNAKSTIVFPNKGNLEGKSRKEILAIISTLDPILKNDLVKKNKELNLGLPNLLKLQDKMQTYLYQLKPACMDFLEWHERNPYHLPKPKC